jgi:hypothetical protein
LRVAILVPKPDYPEPWRWAFDVEAQALVDADCSVHAVPWTDLHDASEFDLVLPLVAWGYHLEFQR